MLFVCEQTFYICNISITENRGLNLIRTISDRTGETFSRSTPPSRTLLGRTKSDAIQYCHVFVHCPPGELDTDVDELFTKVFPVKPLIVIGNFFQRQFFLHMTLFTSDGVTFSDSLKTIFLISRVSEIRKMWILGTFFTDNFIFTGNFKFTGEFDVKWVTTTCFSTLLS